jgi:hypothetical protein
VPLLTCLVDIHPPYRSKNEEICPAKSSWGVNCYANVCALRGCQGNGS